MKPSKKPGATITKPHGGRIWRRSLLLLVLLAVTMGALVLWRWPAVLPAAVAVANTSGPGRGGRDDVPKTPRRVDDPCRATSNAPIPAREPRPTPEAEADHAVLQISFVDPEGQPANRVMFSVQERGRDPAYRTTDDTGRFQYHTRIGASLQIRTEREPESIPLNLGKGYIPMPNYSVPWSARPHHVNITQPLENIEIVVYPSCDVALDIRYEDGTPYAGSLYIRSSGIIREASQTGTGGALVKGVPRGEGATLHLRNLKFGYSKSEFQLPSPDLGGSRPIVIYIPKDNEYAMGLIAVTFAEYANTPVSVRVLCNALVAAAAQEISTSLAWESSPLRPGKYNVIITGEYASCIPEVEVTSNAVTTVEARAAIPASVRARILDSQGNPLVGATLALRLESDAAFYPGRLQMRGVADTSGHDGVVEVGGIARGSFVAHVEALGYEPARLPVSLAAGQTLDLGDVYLGVARGLCIISIKGASPDQRYQVVVLQNQGSTNTYPWRNVMGDSVRLEGLVLGRLYQIGVVLAGGGEVACESVVLTVPDDPVTIRIDVSALKK